MGLRLVYLLRNLTRNPLRNLLTAAAVGLPMMILVLAVAVVTAIDAFLDNTVQQLRLAVVQKSSIVNPLPEGHRAKIEALDPDKRDITAVCGIQWIGGRVEGVQTPLSTLAADADTFLKTFPDYELTQAERDAWTKERRAILVGTATAGQFGWKVGDRVTIQLSVPPYSQMEFLVVALSGDAPDRVTNWIRRDYLDEVFKEARIPYGQVNFFYVKCSSRDALERYRNVIDPVFAGSTDETVTQDEKAFMSAFISQQFDLPTNLRILAAVTVFVAVMAAANTMSMSFRDRISEYATLKALGFGGGIVFTQVQAESLMLCGLGGVVGAMTPYVAFTMTPLRDVNIPVVQTLHIDLAVCGAAIGIALAIGFVAALLPSWSAMRLNAVQAFRSLE